MFEFGKQVEYLLAISTGMAAGLLSLLGLGLLTQCFATREFVSQVLPHIALAILASLTISHLGRLSARMGH